MTIPVTDLVRGEDGSDDDFDAQGLILMNSLISANIRPLKFSNTKVEAVEMLGRMSEYLSSEILLDRVVPYMVNIQCYSNLKQLRPGHTHFLSFHGLV